MKRDFVFVVLVTTFGKYQRTYFPEVHVEAAFMSEIDAVRFCDDWNIHNESEATYQRVELN